MRAWTDYPIPEAGDLPDKRAPIRLVTVLAWDRDKYCSVDGTSELIKRCYLYRERGRCGRVPALSTRQLRKLSELIYGAQP